MDIIEFKENIKYKSNQKVKFKCSQCEKESILMYKKFKLKPYICRNCRLKQSFKNKNWEERNQKSKQTCLKKYGVENPQQNKNIKEKSKQTCLKKYGVSSPLESKELREKGKITSLKRYGTLSPQQSNKVKEKAKNTCLKKYGVEYPSQNKEIRQKQIETTFQKYGVENYGMTKEAREKSRHIWKLTFQKNKNIWLKNCSSKRYNLKEIYFDSYPEICFYIYCKDFNLNIKRNIKPFSYKYLNKEYYYFPDFEIDGKFYEIKGNHFLTENGKWQNPFNHTLDEKYEAKHRCALKNNVIILYENEYQKYIEYVEEKYGKDFLKNLKK